MKEQQKSFSFSKSEKLKSKKLIEKLFVEGKNVTNFPIKLIYVSNGTEKDVPIMAGVTVSKRKFKKAVDRNRIKRLLREAYRLNKHVIFNNIEGNYALLILYLGNEMPSYERIEKSMVDALTKLQKRIYDEEST